MKKILTLAGLAVTALLFSQTIEFKGCPPLFEDQNFTFTTTGTDPYNKKIYITTPVDGDQPCGGLGTCEFKIQWNNTAGHWDFLADSGNGDFVDPYLIYYSTGGNSAATNPPNISIGMWMENTAVTGGACGGPLSNTNATMTGDVHSSVLAVRNTETSKVRLSPNPATDFVEITGAAHLKAVKLFAADGKFLLSSSLSKINISHLPPGVYIVEVETAAEKTVLRLIRK